MFYIDRLEAVYCGCVPLAPNKLVYPEIYPKDNLYNTPAQLMKILRNWCRNPLLFRKHRRKFFEAFDVRKYSSDVLTPMYLDLFK